MKKISLALLGAGGALALAIGVAAPASAAIVYTGSKSCPSTSYAYTRGTVGSGSTIDHHQLIGGYWYNSQRVYNDKSYPISTQFVVGTWVKNFANSYIAASPNAPSATGAYCA